MYNIDIGAFYPLTFDNVLNISQYLEDLNIGITKSILFVEKENTKLVIRCIISGEYLTIEADTEQEINDLHEHLKRRNLYK